MTGGIVHVVQHLAPGGLEVMALELARTQRRSSVSVLVASLEGEAEAAIKGWPRLAAETENLRFLGKRPGLDVALVLRLAALFRRERPRVVHTHHVGPLLYAGLAARLAGIPSLVHTEHDAWHLASPRRRRIVRAALAVSRPVTTADAPHVARAFAQALGVSEPRTILNGVDTKRFVPGNREAARVAFGLPVSAPIIGVSARLERVKGVDVAIRAMARMRPDAVLAVAGRGSEEAFLRQDAACLGLGDRVHFLGLVDDMSAFYPALDALCLPSRDEGLPLSLLEAQSCGVPVVACDVGGVRTGVDPLSGLLVPAEDPDTLASALERVLAMARDPFGPRRFVTQTASLLAAATAYHALYEPEPRP